MKGKYTSYANYNESGVAWIGELPEHWEIKRLKFVAINTNSNVDKKTVEGEIPVSLCNYTDVYYNERITDSISFMEATTKPENIKKFALQAGDLIITKDSESPDDIGIPALVEKSAAGTICGYHLTLIRPNSDIDGAFLLRVLQSRPSAAQFYVSASGVTRFGLSKNDIDSLLICCPPLPEQQAIARFLDRKTAQIDALIAKKEALLAKLAEKRTALISQAVTRGLDPTVPMKDSGVPWLGEVPVHWNASKLLHLTTEIGDGLHGTPEYVDESPYCFINGNNLADGAIKITPSTRYVSEQEYRKYYVPLDESTVLISINGTIGNVALYQGEVVILGKSAAYINCGQELNRAYLEFFLQSAGVRQFFKREVSGTTIFNLSLESIRNLPLVFPPFEEQFEITSYLTGTLAELTKATDKVTRAINLLREYRTALITAAVTGKIDVRSLPEASPPMFPEMEAEYA